MKKNMNEQNIFSLIGLFLFVALIITGANTNANAATDEGFIYGKITMSDNSIYTGQIRWGREETFWTHIFNSTKLSNDNLKLLSRRDRKLLDENSKSSNRSTWFSFRIDFSSYQNEYNHVFATEFGNIKSIKILGREEVEVELKNGEIIELEGGSNDIGTKIKILDTEIGEIDLKWKRVEKIEFMQTPSSLEYKIGEPLYGKVVTSDGEFSGIVQWDLEECVSTDKLDGDSDNGDVSIEFGKIKSITKERRGSLVKLKSGKEIYLTGTNDVNNDNRGVAISVDGIGRVEVGWRDFKSVIFENRAKTSGKKYDDFKTNKNLYGQVKTIDDNLFSGIIIFDLDEGSGIEILNAQIDRTEYWIPFANIKKITPKNSSYSRIELKNGKKLLLGKSQDVTDRNNGILILKDKDDTEPKYIPWDRIDEISFEI